jgi:hypothetical protein
VLRRIRDGGLPLAVDERDGHALIGGQGHPLLISSRDGAPVGPVRGVGVVTEPSMAAVDGAAGRFYVAAAAGLAILDSHSGRVERVLALGAAPVAVAVDPAAHRAFLLTAGRPGPLAVDRAPPVLGWLRQALPWLPFPAPPTASVGGTLTVLDTTRL